MKNLFNKLVLKYIGKTQYIVTAVNVSGSVNNFKCYSIKEVDDLVKDINFDRYFSVQKIEKLRKFKFNYNKEIIQSPLHFSLENVTEVDFVGDYKYSFLKKDESLKNIKRVSSSNSAKDKHEPISVTPQNLDNFKFKENDEEKLY